MTQADDRHHVSALLQRFATQEADLVRWLNRNRSWQEAIWYHWPFWRRPDQTPPAGDWRCWLILAGRGFGKTRTGAEWVRHQAETQPGLRIALVAATHADARTIMVEGESGLRALAPPDQQPVFEPSLRRLSWPNGSTATLYSAAEPEALRGPEHHMAWADECAKWADGDAAWDNLALSLRLGPSPRLVATTTPRPVPLIRRLLADPDTQVTRGRMADNRMNLPPAFYDAMTRTYGGTRLGRQELDGVLIEDVEGALWTRAMISAAHDTAVPTLRRVVVGVDPPTSQTGDACGIITVGLGPDVVGRASWPSGTGRCRDRAAPRRETLPHDQETQMKLFGWKSAGRAAARPALARAFSTWVGGQWPRAYEAQLRELYLTNAVAQRAVRLVAEGVASVGLWCAAHAAGPAGRCNLCQLSRGASRLVAPIHPAAGGQDP